MKYLLSFRYVFNILMISTLLFISACTSTITPAPPARTLSETVSSPTPSVTLTRTLPAPTHNPTITPKPSATPTPEPAVCPAINPKITFVPPEATSTFRMTQILDYLNAGGDPVSINDGDNGVNFSAVIADMDGDQKNEIVLMNSNYPNPLTIHIFHCGEGDYRLAQSFTPNHYGRDGIYLFTSTIFETNFDYLIIQVREGSHWNYHYYALGYLDSRWKCISLAPGDITTDIFLYDADKDNIKEIYITSSTGHSPTSGVGRDVIEEYDWNGLTFENIRTDIPPTLDRIHLLQDAEWAYWNGNPLLAVYYLEMAASDFDPGYKPSSGDTAKPYQRALAYYRRLSIWTYLDRPGHANRVLETMVETFPEGEPGYEFVVAGKVFLKEFENGKSAPTACYIASAYLSQDDLMETHFGNWGNANVHYNALSLCGPNPDIGWYPADAN